MRRLFALVVLTCGAVTACGHHRAVDRAALASRYAAAVKPFLLDGSRLVAVDVRPGVGDLEFHEVTPEDYRSRAASWKQQLERIRRQVAGVRPPSFLRDAAAQYDASLRQYLAAIDAFVVASYAPSDGLAAAITRAVPAAQQADATYDRAEAMVQAVIDGAKGAGS